MVFSKEDAILFISLYISKGYWQNRIVSLDWHAVISYCEIFSTAVVKVHQNNKKATVLQFKTINFVTFYEKNVYFYHKVVCHQKRNSLEPTDMFYMSHFVLGICVIYYLF